MVALALLLLVPFSWYTYRMARRLAVEPYVDFHAFYLAADAARTGKDPYRVGTEMYIYPPMLAAWLAPLSLLDETAAAWLWYGLSVFATVLSLALIWVAVARTFELPRNNHLAWAVAALSLLTWGTQVRWEYEQGQTDWVMLLPLCLMLLSAEQLPWLAGLCLGFAINVKYLPIAFLLHALVRRRWSFAGWTVLGTTFWAFLPACLYGWDRNLTYLAQGVAGLGKIVGIQIEGQAGYVFPLTYDRSVTVPSALARIVSDQGWPLAWVILGTTVVGLITIGLLWWLYRRNHFEFCMGGGTGPLASRLVTLERLGLFVLMLVFSPQAMMRHYYLALPLIVTLAALLFRRSSRLLALSGLGLGILGSVGADLLVWWDAREFWKYYSLMAFCSLGMVILAIGSGLIGLAEDQARKLEQAARHTGRCPEDHQNGQEFGQVDPGPGSVC